MTAHVVVPFPLARRTDFIHRHAEIMQQLVRQGDVDIAEMHLAQQLNVQRNKLRRRGVAEGHIDREIMALHQAIVSLIDGGHIAS